MKILEDVNTVLGIIANLITIIATAVALARRDGEPPPRHRKK